MKTTGYRVSYFIKLILSFSLLALLLIALIGGLMVHQTGQIMKEEISKDSLQRLGKISDYVELSILRRFEGSSMTRVLSTINPQSTDDIQFFLDQAHQNYMYRITRLVNDLRTLTLANEGLHNISIYFTKDSFVVDQNFYYQGVQSYFDPVFLQALPKITPYQWYSRDAEASGASVLTYVMPLPYKAKGDQIKGYMFLDVQTSYVEQMLKNMLASPKDRLFVLNDQEQLLAKTEKNNEPLLTNTALDSFGKENQAVWNKSTGEVLSIFHASLSSGDRTYVLITTVDTLLLSTTKLKQYIFISCASVLLFGLLISCVLSYRFQKPMRSILNRLSSLPNFAFSAFVGNEYDAILTAFESQHNTITKLKNQMFTKQLGSLLAGDTLEIHLLPSQYFNSSFAIVFLKLQQGNMADLRNKISIPSSGHCRVELISINEHEMTMMYVLHENVSFPYEAICIDVRSKYSLNSLSCQYSLAVGSIVHQLEHIQLSYQQARDAESYSYLFGYNKIVLYSDIAHRDKMVDPELIEQWKRVLRTYDGKQIELFIKQFTEHVLKEPYRLDSINMSVLQFCIYLSQMIMGTNIQHILPSHDWFQTIHKPSFLETVEELKSVSLQAAEELNASTTHAYSFQIMKIKEYIDTHLHEDFSLNKLAKMVNLSPSYVSTLFKDIVNISFSEYLTQTRLDQAASLLVTTNDSVSSIADQVGYRNVQYFCTKFRQKFGVSPNQFRKSDVQLNKILDANIQNQAVEEDKSLASHIIVQSDSHREVPKI